MNYVLAKTTYENNMGSRRQHFKCLDVKGKRAEIIEFSVCMYLYVQKSV